MFNWKSISNIHYTNYLPRLTFVNKIIRLFLYVFFKIYRLFILKSKTGNGVLILAVHKIGDSVFTIPAIKEIYNHYPDVPVTIMCSKAGEQIYKYFIPQCTTSIIEDKEFKFGERIANHKVKRKIKQLDPSIIIDLTTGLKSVSIFLNSNAPLIFGINKEYFKGAYTSFTLMRDTPPLFQMYLDPVKNIFPDVSDSKIFHFTEFNPDYKILIHPFAGWRAKEWGLNKFIKLGSELKRNYNVEFVVEAQTLSNETYAAIASEGISINETKSISDLLRLIEECSVMVSNDTGSIYLAAMMKKATYTIYGPTNPEFSTPIGERHKYIQKKLTCTPVADQYCFTFAGQFGCPSFECMRQLGVYEVLNDITDFLQRLAITKITK